MEQAKAEQIVNDIPITIHPLKVSQTMPCSYYGSLNLFSASLEGPKKYSDSMHRTLLTKPLTRSGSALFVFFRSPEWSILLRFPDLTSSEPAEFIDMSMLNHE